MTIARRTGTASLQTVLRLIVLAALLPMLLFAVLAVSIAAREQQAAVRAGMTATARALSLAVDRQVDIGVTSLKALATSPSLQSGDYAAFREQAVAFTSAVDGWLAVVRPDGQLLMNTRVPAGQALPRTSNREWMSHVFGPDPVSISGAITGPVVQQPFVAISLQVAVPNGPVVLTLAIEPRTLSRLLLEQDLPKGAIGIIADQNGVILARTLMPERIGEKMVLVPVAPGGLERSRTHEGLDVYLAWHTSPLSGWSTGVAVPVGMVDGEARRMYLLLGAVGGFLLLLAVLAAREISRRLTKPMMAYAGALQGADGDGARLPDVRSGVWELDVLTSSLRSRIGQLESAIAARDAAQAELQALSANMESVIETRTRELASTRARASAVFANSPDLRTILRHTPDDRFVFEDANRPTLEAFGWTREYILGRALDEVYPAAAAADAAAQLRACLRQGGPLSYEVERIVLGQRRWFQTTLVPIENDGQALVVSNARDVSEKLELQERLRQSQKMETFGQLTGGVAHDFNNLLSAVIGNLELLQKRLPATKERLRRHVDAAMEGAQRGASLTQRMLAFARRQELRPLPVYLPELVGSMSALLERSLGPLVTLRTEFAEALPPALADGNQLELALLNLAVNARDAMPKGGVVTLRAEVRAGHALPGGEPRTGDYVVVSVIDTGEGMAPWVLAKAAEPFFTTKGPGQGTGLGLAMVHGLAAQSGGALRLLSEPGAGTTAEIWLPVAVSPAPPRDEVAATEARPPMDVLTVLLVDDDELVRMGVSAMLEDLGHRVIESPSGSVALEILRGRTDIDLVVTDYGMPGMSGLELATAVRRERAAMPVLLATGYAELPAGEAERFERISKPFSQEQLAAGIAAAVSAFKLARAIGSVPAE